MVKARDSQRGARNERLHQPRLAELVASELRRSILQGDLQDGELLPGPRRALRAIRGWQGRHPRDPANPGERRPRHGAPREYRRRDRPLPHAPIRGPNAGDGMEARSVQASHLASALQEFEPLCATMSSRPDRTETVVPQLRAVLDESEGALGDPIEFTRLARRFHEAMVAGCGKTR